MLKKVDLHIVFYLEIFEKTDYHFKMKPFKRSNLKDPINYSIKDAISDVNFLLIWNFFAVI